MKKNGNNERIIDYYIGLDAGTNSVGWAVSDKEYKISKFKGNAMWGVNLFEEAKGAAERRTSRTARRRLDRRNQRLLLLEMIFAPYITQKDPDFFKRMHESSLLLKDKSIGAAGDVLFADADKSDKDFFKRYPTMYHLRSELIRSNEEHDIREVFLAIHHIMKKRGHFLFEVMGSDDTPEVGELIDELSAYTERIGNVEFKPKDKAKYIETLKAPDFRINDKKKALKAAYGSIPKAEDMDEDALNLSVGHVSDLLAGASVKAADLFCNKALKDIENKSIRLSDNIEEKLDSLIQELGEEQAELLIKLKEVFDAVRLSQILGEEKYLSDAKVRQFNENKKTQKELKAFVKKHLPEKYYHIFSERKDNLNNFAAYSRYKTHSGDHVCTQEEFCTFLKSELKSAADKKDYLKFKDAIDEKTLMPRLSSSENSVIPHQLHERELKAILKNAATYLPFLNEADSERLTAAKKLIAVFNFRIPYYVGPLNRNSPNSWVVRADEKIYPWNFEKVVSLEESAEKFLTNLIGRCTYTGEYVLPKDSLIYSKYMVLNEINSIKVNGKPLPVEVKQKLFEALFICDSRKVTKKRIRQWLFDTGYLSKNDEGVISGVDDVIKSSLKSYHDLKDIIEKAGKDAAEDIIKSILIFGGDKRVLGQRIRREHPELGEKDIRRIMRLKYSDWGRLSKTFLKEICIPDKYGEAISIMDMLWTTNCNLMQLLSDDYQFAQKAKEYKDERFGISDKLKDKLDAMYISPAVRRSVRQALRIVDEIVDIKGGAPEKIFVEVTRGTRENLKGKRTQTRKERLSGLYERIKNDAEYKEVYEKFISTEENRLRSDKLYLYYTQLGKCMYSGASIDIEELLKNDDLYDIDHIFPQSRIKDDSIENRVLVKKELNGKKGNNYPISGEIRKNMKEFWKALKDKGLIGEIKYDRLTRSTPLTDEELQSFVARQLVQTSQSVKALAVLLSERYPNTRIVTSKAVNVDDFRQKYDIIKCRDVSDIHHARDAYLNIVVGNVYDTKFTEKFMKNIATENYSLNKVFEYDTKGAWDAEKTIVTVKKYVAKSNIRFTRMPYIQKGELFDLQLMPKGKGQLEAKQGRPVDSYGGYNKLKGAYFFAVEHTEKKKRIRTLEPVLIYQRKLYESDPETFCRDVMGLKDPVIIAPCIRTDALLEFDGVRLSVSGRTGDQYVLKHNYQLAADTAHEKYIKAVSKFVERNAKSKESVIPTKFDAVTREQNEELFEWFLLKLESPVYRAVLSAVKNTVSSGKDAFIKMSEHDQCKILMEILKAFKCDAQNANFEILNGKKTVGRIQRSKNLRNLKTAYLINQSVTGLFEVKTDLLK
ncbi:MAG: type II CRISPR RNA-guided endonuclease Cas9 [Clostridia bacterium]|nr:type II CRISPR RNA-guided endonuclease Cas9 [Clostridia bacterium]